MVHCTCMVMFIAKAIIICNRIVMEYYGTMSV